MAKTQRIRKYNSSTLARAHGVLRKNFKLDLILGSCIKQRIGTAAPIASQPMPSESCVTIASSVMPSRAGRLAGFLFASMPAFYRGSPPLSDYNAASYKHQTREARPCRPRPLRERAGERG